jgi:hypothetical protein
MAAKPDHGGTPRSAQGITIAEVSGGESTNPLSRSKVANDQLTIAREASLAEAGYLSRDPATASMSLTVTLVELTAPRGRWTFSVSSLLRYRLRVLADGRVAYDDTIRAEGRAGVSDAVLGVKRVRRANETSIRQNIAAFLSRLPEALTRAARPSRRG